ncbi:MAG: hypothetical protein ACI8W8_002627 [Rhodothermales bacterium]|jgi:hypothetical protein
MQHLILVLLMTVGVAAGDGYVRNATPPTDGRVGSNYTPAYASSPIQFWHDFRPEVVEKELAAAEKNFGLNMLRVYINTTNYFAEKDVLFRNLETFIGIADKAGLRPGFVFFSGDHRADNPVYLDGPYAPRPGHHNGRWPSSPQEHEWDKDDPDNVDRFKPYVQDVIAKYKDDQRVLFWEIHNEPPHDNKRRDKLKRAAYAWAKELEPIQPVLNCEFKGGWGDSEVTDIVSSHVYHCAWGLWNTFADVGLKEGNFKGTMFTEAGARWKATRRNHGGPTDVMFWLDAHRRTQNKPIPGVMLTWELNVSNSNTRWHWIDNGYQRGEPDPEPEIPWCGLQWSNGDPVSLAEAAIVRKHANGKWDALFYDDFQRGGSKWKLYGMKHTHWRHGIYMLHGTKAVAGDPTWTDYVVEGRALFKRKWLLRDEKRKDYSTVEGDPAAGLLLRVNDAGEAYDDLRASSVTHDGKALILGKFNKGSWKELSRFDLAANAIQARQMEWSMIRVEAVGPRIRVHFNRYHGDPDKGWRIDYTDRDDPILSGAIGVSSFKTDAMFDDVVVLPAR